MKVESRICHIITVVCLAAIAVGCSRGKGTAAERPAADKVVVSVAPLEYFARNIGGDRVEVICLVPASADPETFEPTLAQLSEASQAGVMLTVGLLPFESKVTDAVTASNNGIRVASLADSIALIDGTHGHGGADPHIWASLRNARVMARHTCRVLSEANPSEAGYFQKRLEALDHRLDSLDRIVASRLAAGNTSAFFVWHPSLAYFARDYGLTQLAVGDAHKETSLPGLMEQVEHINRSDGGVFFFQRELDSRQCQVIAEETGLRMVEIDPMSADLETLIIDVTDALTKSSRP